ncbi:hypothetical protein ACB098_12G137700 [Castanea mollissima]
MVTYTKSREKEKKKQAYHPADSSQLPIPLDFHFHFLLLLRIRVTLTWCTYIPKPVSQTKQKTLNQIRELYPLWVGWIYGIRARSFSTRSSLIPTLLNFGI